MVVFSWLLSQESKFSCQVASCSLSIWSVERSRSYVFCPAPSPDAYTLYDPGKSSPSTQFDRQSDISSRWLVENMPIMDRPHELT